MAGPGRPGLPVDRGHFDALLLDHARACGVGVLQPAGLEAWERCADEWRLAVRCEGRHIGAESSVLADVSGRAGTPGRRRRRSGSKALALNGYWKGAGLPGLPLIEAGISAWVRGAPLPSWFNNTPVFMDPATPGPWTAA
jgi:hypothetical protein